jgi:ketosteroid isomerase-like protein
MKTIKADELPESRGARDFFDALDLSEEVVLEADGEPRVVLVAPHTFEERRQSRERLFSLIDTIRGQNPNADSEGCSTRGPER